jgi:hypothetical protein
VNLYFVHNILFYCFKFFNYWLYCQASKSEANVLITVIEV